MRGEAQRILSTLPLLRKQRTFWTPNYQEHFFLSPGSANPLISPETKLCKLIATPLVPRAMYLVDPQPPGHNSHSLRITFLPSALVLAGCALLLTLCPPAFGYGITQTGADTNAVAQNLRVIDAAGSLPEMKLTNFSDFKQDLETVYGPVNFAPIWVRDGQPTPQAYALMTVLQNSQQKGLIAEDYDASRWSARLAALKASPGNANTVAQFDAALTISALRYLSNIRIGRLNPKPLKFDVTLDQKHYDLPHFLAEKVLPANNVPEVMSEAEPQYLGYKRTVTALQAYLVLAAQDHGNALPVPPHVLAVGNAYPDAEQLRQRLHFLGDLPKDAGSDPSGVIYDQTLLGAVQHFQARHGLIADGKLDKGTLRELNMPISARVLQLEASLERWRWLPTDYPLLPVAVNLPGFRLRVFSDDHTIAMRMNVVVGEAVRHQTPVFAKEMKYIVFRPYWNLPLDIKRTEIVPKLRADPRYLVRKGFEVTDGEGHVVSGGAVSSATIARIRSGSLLVRQKPGPSNALGLVKFMFPNEFDIYLHSTPTPQLFNRSKRDFSHGCIRVEKPAELAAWLLRDQPKWTLEAVKAAMQSGHDNEQVNLTKPVPVVIAYMTAIVEEDGQVYFFDDIYGHDSSLDAALEKESNGN